MYEAIGHRVEDGVAEITIKLPRHRNALSVKAMQEVTDALNRAEEDDSVGAVMITGAEDAFCAGFYLREIPLDKGVAGVRDHFRIAALWWHQMIHKIIRVKRPVLAAINGVAAGGGLGISLASDMAICADSAKFVCAWHTIGIGNDTATSYSLARIVGMRRAMELMLTDRTLYPEEAKDWGLVSRVYPKDEFREVAWKVARELAAAPTHLQVMAKERFHAGWMQPVEECTEFEIQNVIASVTHPHFMPCLTRFLDGHRADRPQVELPAGV
uniref:4-CHLOROBENZOYL COENZYME A DEHALOGENASE n=1 Tax=Pseudomonas sp. (strain CBS-3) TaxID=72586 RepID=UPI000011288A|nr:Chain B, 4-chlorobenzoyl Coenzyme A Dehalogenase [Pseudomonas sp. CBS3]